MSEEKIEVVEEKDGSAVVELPENIDNPQAEPEETQSADAAADDDQDHPDDTDAVREARRARRRAKKELIKRTNEEKDHRLTLLQKQNQELMERLSVIERKSHSSDIARVDKAIEDEKLRMQYAAAKMREATDNSDGATLTKAQEMWYESRRKLEALDGLRQRVAEANTQDNSAINPRVQRMANRWIESNPWYDPANGDDEDSQIAKIIDQKLMKEGYDPASEDYWDELDKRLSKRLPHRYNESYDEAPKRRPKSFVTGSSREVASSGGGRNSFVLAPEQVRAMKDAGMWDDPDKRAKMIKRYAQEARNYKG